MENAEVDPTIFLKGIYLATGQFTSNELRNDLLLFPFF